ncbi:hypothetical protein [Candidatus Tokpelaia sp.]|uniref:hypothetical protein n=1 Tax=Candidatus Tokpelaia sp. TaxID=2233777 RepID=UPI0016801028|nr:hypothetical protein [Candidatus Tokpelaia sp.]
MAQPQAKTYPRQGAGKAKNARWLDGGACNKKDIFLKKMQNRTCNSILYMPLK